MGQHEWIPRHRSHAECLCRGTHDADCEAVPLIGQTRWGLIAIAIWALFMGVLLLNG